MKNVILPIFCFFFIGLTFRLSAQNLMSQATQIEKENSLILLPSYVQFDMAKAPAFSEKPDFINLFVGASASATAQLMRKENDDLGFTHYRYQQTLRNVPIEGAEYVYHVKNGKVLTANGFWLTEDALRTIERKTRDQITENAAFKAALQHINANQYKWDLPEEEAFLKTETGDKMATYLPKGEKVFVKYTDEWQNSGIRLAWKFDIYAHEPMSRRFIFIDAENGRVLTEIEQIHHTDVSGTAATAYSGTKMIVSDNYSTNLYRLRESANGLGRGKGINTYNLKNKTSYGSAVDFTNSSATWTTTGTNQYALDAHFGAEATYDYYKLKHNRNSIDNAGFAINSYVHYSRNYVNAFWDGSRMTYGDGNGSSVTPLTALDVCGHEITHGLTSKTANLTYSNESGALNESFSDIFGTAVEFFAKPPFEPGNWAIGEDMNYIIRNMANPNQFSDPDTYKGTFWYAGTSDNGGVHTNSGVQNYWFYLLSQGGSGTNDKGTPFSVTGLGIDKAAKIAFRSLTVYLTSAAQFANARTGAIQAATDLYGATSTEVKQTTNAWCAVGVGTCATAAAAPEGSIASNNNNTNTTGLIKGSFITNISPNPARSVVNLTMASLSDGEAHILIANTLGQAIWSKNSYMTKGETLQTIDVSQWAKGFYTVRIQQGTNIKTEKLVID